MSYEQSVDKQLIDKSNIEKKDTLKSLETRWKYAVFPAMVAFIILAAFGFYLIYGMLQRMEDLSHNVYRMTEVIHTSMPAMQNDMTHMSHNMQQMNSTMQYNFPRLEKNVSSMSHDMKDISYSTTSMANTTYNLSHNVWELNKNVSQPLSLMNNMIPWNNTKSSPPPVPRNFTTTSSVYNYGVYPQYPLVKVSQPTLQITPK